MKKVITVSAYKCYSLGYEYSIGLLVVFGEVAVEVGVRKKG